MNNIDVYDDARPGLPWERRDRAICPLVWLPVVQDSVHAQENALPSIPISYLAAFERKA